MTEYDTDRSKSGESTESERTTEAARSPATKPSTTATRWRYTCPHGHTNWQRRVNPDDQGRRYYCKTCGERFLALYDRKRGEYVDARRRHPEGRR